MLATQTEFEILLGRVPSTEPVPSLAVIYFTASWCGACKNLDVPALQAAATAVGAAFLKCDVDVNDYTPGYCGIKKIPTFLVIKDKKIYELSSSDTATVAAWIKEIS